MPRGGQLSHREFANAMVKNVNIDEPEEIVAIWIRGTEYGLVGDGLGGKLWDEMQKFVLEKGETISCTKGYEPNG